MERKLKALALILNTSFVLTSAALASDWPSWRGPDRNGVSDEKGLVSSWSPEGENVLWQIIFVFE